MITIHKHELKPTHYQEIELQIGCIILDLQNQDGHIEMWVMVDTDAKKIKRKFLVYGTGEDLYHGTLFPLTHLKTIQVQPFVWHIFEQEP